MDTYPLSAYLLAGREQQRLTREDLSDRIVCAGFEPIEPGRIRQLEVFQKAPPADGAELGTVLSCLGLSHLRALELVNYWPPVPSPFRSTSATATELLAMLAQLGLEVVPHSDGSGYLVRWPGGSVPR